MGGQRYLVLHPFNRVPILDHGGFRLYETAAIALYADEAFAGPSLQPKELRQRAKMHQWISALNNYYYPYMAYHLGHERLIYPTLGIPADEKVVVHALPRIAVALDVMEREFAHEDDYLVGDQLTLADLFLLPMTTLSLTPEGQEMLKAKPRINAWCARMDALPSVVKVRATVAPHIGEPVEHARKWVDNHRPRYSVRSLGCIISMAEPSKIGVIGLYFAVVIKGDFHGRRNRSTTTHCGIRSRPIRRHRFDSIRGTRACRSIFNQEFRHDL